MAEPQEVAANFISLLRKIDEDEERFHTGAVAKVLAKDEQGNYILRPADIPPLFFNPSVDSALEIQNYIDAMGDAEPIEEYGAYLLREYALTNENRIDLDRLIAWENYYKSALSALPRLREKIEAIKKAELAVDQARINRETALNAFMNSPAGLFIDNDHVTAIKKVFELPDTTVAMIDLVDRLKDNPDALAGLKRGVADHMAPLIADGRYVEFFDSNEGALLILFSPEDMGRIRAIRLNLARRDLNIDRGDMAPQPGRRGFFSLFKR